jgi:hypothetical protein
MTFFSSKKVLSCSPIYSYQPRQHRTAAQHVSMLKEWKKEVVGLCFKSY